MNCWRVKNAIAALRKSQPRQRDRGAFFLPVRLTISPVELTRRVIAPGRAERLKAIDPQAALTEARQRECSDRSAMGKAQTTAEEVAESMLNGLRRCYAWTALIVERWTDDALENSHCHKVCHPITRGWIAASNRRSR